MFLDFSYCNKKYRKPSWVPFISSVCGMQTADWPSMHFMGTSASVVGVGYRIWSPPKKKLPISSSQVFMFWSFADVFLEFVQEKGDPEFNWLWARLFFLLNFVILKIWWIFFQNVAKISRIYTRTISNFYLGFKDGKNEIRIDGFGGGGREKDMFLFTMKHFKNEKWS